MVCCFFGHHDIPTEAVKPKLIECIAGLVGFRQIYELNKMSK